MPDSKVNRGSYAGGSGLKEDWDGTIKEVAFEKQENSQNYAAHLFIEADDGEEVEMFLGLGGDWTTYDGGRTVEHPKGPNRKFNNSTQWSRFLNRAFDAVYEVEGEENEMIRRDRQFEGRASQNAGSLEGMRFHFDVEPTAERRSQDKKGPDGNLIMKPDGKPEQEWVEVQVDRMWPQRYLGLAGGTLHPQAVPTGAVQESTLPSSGDGRSGPTPEQEAVQHRPMQAENTGQAGQSSQAPQAIAGLPMADQINIKALAKQHDYGNFVDAVMDLTLSTGQPTLEVPEVIQALSDESFYLSLRG